MATPNPDEQPSLALLVNVRADDTEPWDWHRIGAAPPPPEPVFLNDHERAARAELDGYRPSLLDRFTGASVRRRAELEAAVKRAANTDVLEYSAAVAQHREAHHRWSTAAQLAPRVLQHDEPACRAALRFAMAFREIPGLRSQPHLDSIRDRVATLTCVVDDPDREVLDRSVLSHVMLSTEHIGPNPLYQDRACSVAIRIARETFAVLPIAHAVVNLVAEELDPRTGLRRPDTILTIRFSLEALTSLTSYGMQPMPRRVRSTDTTGIEPALQAEVWDDAVTPPLEEWEGDTLTLGLNR